MNKDLFKTLDLNLIRTFQIIYQERNLNRAAERLFVTQPAMSKALAKLRHQFDDELFIRSHQGLLPTEFSQHLFNNLAPVIEELSVVLNSKYEFDPKELSGSIKICISPFLIQAIGDELYQRIHADAPNVQLMLLNWSLKTFTNLQDQEIDLGINYQSSASYKDITSEQIGLDQYSIFVRKDHPIQGDQITLEEASRYNIVTIINSDWNFNESFAERELRKRGLKAMVTFRSELPSSLVKTVLNSDALLPSSKFLSKFDPRLRRLDIIGIDEINQIPVNAYSHKQLQQSAKQSWLINHIKELVK